MSIQRGSRLWDALQHVNHKQWQEMKEICGASASCTVLSGWDEGWGNVLMRRALSILLAAMIAAAAGGPLAATAVGAQGQSVDVWVEVATANPAVGCFVDTSIEVRGGGASVSGADVVLTLSDDADNTIYSSDRGVTDDAGVVHLGYDTSATGSGTKTWLEVVVNGSYVGGRTVMVDGGSYAGAPSLLDMSGEVATISDSVVDSPVEQATSSDAVMIPGVSAYLQQRSLSCEYAAVSIATGALGSWVSEYDLEAVTPLSANPHWGYRGNINGVWGNTVDYGIYADALIPGLNQFGFQGHTFYGGPADLMSSIDQGRPTLVWLGLWGDVSHDEYTEDGSRFQLTQAMHVMVAYGYDSGGVYLSDPGTGQYRYYDWGTFDSMWQVMDGMALGVSW